MSAPNAGVVHVPRIFVLFKAGEYYEDYSFHMLDISLKQKI